MTANRTALPRPCLMLVTDRSASPLPLEEAVALAVEGGVQAVQLREKDLPPAQLLSLALRLRRVTLGRALLLVNDRVDVALACGADGVHLGENSLPPAVPKRLAPGRLLVGRSVHSARGALEAQRAGADYLVVGTVFPTPSHPGLLPAGTGLLEEVAGAVDIPFLAIGGVDPGRVAPVVAAGASGVAVVRAILASPDPRGSAGRLREALEEAWRRRERGDNRNHQR